MVGPLDFSSSLSGNWTCFAAFGYTDEKGQKRIGTLSKSIKYLIPTAVDVDYLPIENPVCQTDEDACDASRCSHHGACCIKKSTSIETCRCSSAYEGARCEKLSITTPVVKPPIIPEAAVPIMAALCVVSLTLFVALLVYYCKVLKESEKKKIERRSTRRKNRESIDLSEHRYSRQEGIIEETRLESGN